VLVTYDPKHSQLQLKHVGQFHPAPDKSLQLWALHTSGGPKSLGVLGDGTVVRLPARSGEVNQVPALAISLEPKGGVPAGSGPSGPVLFKGALIQTTL
jgi:anti-sigma-K factor RskA